MNVSMRKVASYDCERNRDKECNLRNNERIV